MKHTIAAKADDLVFPATHQGDVAVGTTSPSPTSHALSIAHLQQLLSEHTADVLSAHWKQTREE